MCEACPTETMFRRGPLCEVEFWEVCVMEEGTKRCFLCSLIPLPTLPDW